MGAVPPLAGILRYGDVRGSDTSAVAGVLRGIVLRSAVGLPGAGVGADEETGAKLADARRRRQRARSRCCEDEPLTRALREALRRVAAGDRLPGILAGRATRLLLRRGRDRPGRRDVPRALAGRGARARRMLDRGLHRHLRPRARPRPRPARDPRRLDRDPSPRTPSRTSSRSCAERSPSSRPASAAASANASANLKGTVPFTRPRSTQSAPRPRSRRWRGCSGLSS